MLFKEKLIKAKLIKRYKRFLADVELDDGSIITVHCPNPGAMLGITKPNSNVYLSKSNNLKRKLLYTWEMVEIDNVFIGVNTQNPNKLIYEMLINNTLKEFRQYNTIKQEVKYSQNSRIDFLLSNDDEQCFIEVKNVHLVRNAGIAEFPDCITKRGSKHQNDLIKMRELGHKCYVVYVVQRNDVEYFNLAKDLDAQYYDSALSAKRFGIKSLALSFNLSDKSIIFNKALEVIF